MNVLRFCVPGLPTAWARTGTRIVQSKGTSGRCAKDFCAVHYTPTPMRKEQERIWPYCAKAMRDQDIEKAAGAVALYVLAKFRLPSSLSRAEKMRRIWHTQKPDDDNIRKLVCDALSGIAWNDDCQVVGGPPWKVWSLNDEGYEVWIAQLGQDPCAAFRELRDLGLQFLARAEAVTLAGRSDGKDGTVRLVGLG